MGLLTCNLLVTSSLRIASHAITTNGVVELGPSTNNFSLKDTVSIYLNEESIKLAKIIIEKKDDNVDQFVELSDAVKSGTQ
ncbi:hypothetical protein HPULCUR_001503 [Helicostylum pulchrum]|uniref:Uncharacterized protein n=1 Tax=Helicostylum pulchrum TaxID=562976 RepID=A0ABP9XMX0_9FUNG